MSWLSSFLNPGKGYKNAAEETKKYYDEAQGRLNPYNQNGQNAYAGLSGAMNNLLNPEELHDKWVKGYKESEAAKQAEGMAQQHGLDAASSMGLMGSSPALGAIQAGTAGIVAQDRQQYLNDLMEKYKTGAGIGQSIYGTGADAAGHMSQNDMNQGQNAGGLKYGETNAPGNMFGNIVGGIGRFAGNYLTGGMGKGGYGRGMWSPVGGQ